MNKTSWAGVATIIFGIIVLIGAIAECPCKPASVSVSVFMILTGICFTCLGNNLEGMEEECVKEHEHIRRQIEG